MGEIFDREIAGKDHGLSEMTPGLLGLIRMQRLLGLRVSWVKIYFDIFMPGEFKGPKCVKG